MTPPTMNTAGQPKGASRRATTMPPRILPTWTPQVIAITRPPCRRLGAKSESSAMEAGMPPPMPSPVTKRQR